MKLAIVSPTSTYDPQNEAAFREEVRKAVAGGFSNKANLLVPFGKLLQFTSAQGEVISFGYNASGEFTVQQDATTPFSLASIDYVSTVETGLEGSIAALETSLTASIGATNANVTTNTAAIATINGAAAFWETVVSASGSDLAAVRLKAGASGSYLELISTVLRLANISNGSVIEVMRATSGEAYFSRPISADSASRRVTIGPGYGVSGSEVVLWFGPNTTAPSAQSRTNGYFALGTDGKVYFGTTDASTATAPLTATFSPSSVNTTHTTNTPLNQAVTVTPAGGSGTYTYVWSVSAVYSGSTPTLSGQLTNTCTVNVTHSAIGTIDGIIMCTITDTVTGKSINKYWGYYSEGTGGGSGAGGGGGLPP